MKYFYDLLVFFEKKLSFKSRRAQTWFKGNAGNDSIIAAGNDGDTVSVILSGGNDTIHNFNTATGCIVLGNASTTIKGIQADGNDLVLTIGKNVKRNVTDKTEGTLRIIGAADEAVRIYDSQGKFKGTKRATTSVSYLEHWFTEDDNLMATDIDSILDPSAEIVSSEQNILSSSTNFTQENEITSLTYNQKQKK